MMASKSALGMALLAVLGLCLLPSASADRLPLGQHAGVVEVGGGNVATNRIPITPVLFGPASLPTNGLRCGFGSIPCGFLSFATAPLVSTEDGQDPYQGSRILTVVGELPGDKIITMLMATYSGSVSLTQLSSNTLLLSGSVTLNTVNPSLAALIPGVGTLKAGASQFLVKGRLDPNGSLDRTRMQNMGLVSGSETSAMALLGSGLLLGAGLLRRRVRG
jgi:hypothetical protein